MKILYGYALATVCGLTLLAGCNPVESVSIPTTPQNLVRGADTKNNTEVSTYPIILLRTFQGVPQHFVKPLERSMKIAAQTHGFQIDPTRRKRYVYAFTGDFGAIKEAGSNIISYRWTITDTNGNFVHSFLGNLRGSYGATHPWQGFQEADLQRLANESLSHFSSWLKRKR